MLHFIDYIFFLTTYKEAGSINRVEDASYVIQGYLMAMQDEKLNEFMFEFSSFMCNKLGIADRIEWSKVIRFNSHSDAHSLELFETFFRDYVDNISY
jgi:hypothetical protein